MEDAFYPTRSKVLKSTLLPDGYLVIVDEKSDRAVTLNPIGAAVWEFCDGERSTDEITEELAQLLPGAGSLRDEVKELVGQLCRDGLLELRQKN